MARQADAFPTTSAPVELTDRERRLIECEIQKHLDEAERCVALLDAADGDADLEPYLAGTSCDDRDQDAGEEGEASADDDLSSEDQGGEPFGGCMGVE